jgi:hypothetical protein
MHVQLLQREWLSSPVWGWQLQGVNHAHILSFHCVKIKRTRGHVCRSAVQHYISKQQTLALALAKLSTIHIAANYHMVQEHAKAAGLRSSGFTSSHAKHEESLHQIVFLSSSHYCKHKQLQRCAVNKDNRDLVLCHRHHLILQLAASKVQPLCSNKALHMFAISHHPTCLSY